MPLKLILMSPDGTVGADGKAREDVLRDLCIFISRMARRGVQVALWSRSLKILGDEPLEAYLTRISNVPVRHFLAASGSLPAREFKSSVDPILTELGIARHETILIGSRRTDMLAGVNNQLLLLRPAWYGDDMDYGFRFESVNRLAQFCEIFALRDHPIYWSIDDGAVQVRSMGPYSTYFAEFAEFGSSARQAAKENQGDPEFWFFAVVSALYFSGLVHKTDYICPFPGHNPAAPPGIRTLFDEVMTRFCKCFRKFYLPDLILRHQMSQKSQYLPADKKTFANQIDTINLNRRPRRYDNPTPPKTPLALKGKHVLVVDDFITNGRSLDVARAFIESTGGTAILFSWLKTINTNFYHMRSDPPLTPYQPYTVAEEPAMRTYGYHRYIVAPEAPDELNRILDAYRNWKWP
jgi:hypothetical protein